MPLTILEGCCTLTERSHSSRRRYNSCRNRTGCRCTCTCSCSRTFRPGWAGTELGQAAPNCAAGCQSRLQDAQGPGKTHVEVMLLLLLLAVVDPAQAPDWQLPMPHSAAVLPHLRSRHKRHRSAAGLYGSVFGANRPPGFGAAGAPLASALETAVGTSAETVGRIAKARTVTLLAVTDGTESAIKRRLVLGEHVFDLGRACNSLGAPAAFCAGSR